MGGGWRAWDARSSPPPRRKNRIGYDYVHSAVDDHSRLAYSEIHPDEQGATAAGFLIRAGEFFASCGIPQIRGVMTDNHWSYTKSQASTDALRMIGADHLTIRPRCPWQNGKVERFNRTPQTEWAYRQIFTKPRTLTRPANMAPALQPPAQTQLPRTPPTNQPSVTSLISEYI